MGMRPIPMRPRQAGAVMVDPISRRRWLHRLLYLALAAVILFIQLLPVNDFETGFPGPDLTLAISFAWLLRRPEYVPALFIVLVAFWEDVMFWRPLGLWPLIVLLGSEWLRRREETLRDLPFVFEMGLVAAIWLVMLIANRMVLHLVFVEPAPLGLDLLRYLVTLAAYPLVVLASAVVLGLRRAAPGEVDAFGQRL